MTSGISNVEASANSTFVLDAQELHNLDLLGKPRGYSLVQVSHV